jgi:L-histidine N-alpha-methyltransferase
MAGNVSAPAAPLTVEFHHLGLDKRQALVEDVRAGLTRIPKELPPRWFYDFAEHLDRIPRFGRQLVIFLGGTMGNFLPAQRDAFLASVARMLQPGDTFLLGVDLVKDQKELVAAYDDAQGVTAAFNLNVLNVINRELDADFDLSAFAHVARYDEQRDWIEMHLRSLRKQTVSIPHAGLTVEFDEGELMRTEISAKFTRPRVEECFGGAGLRMQAWYTDERQRFALALAAKE